MVRVCEQTAKPKARPLSDEWRSEFCLPAHFKWHVVGAGAIGFGQTLDEAISNWRQCRLDDQTMELFK